MANNQELDHVIKVIDKLDTAIEKLSDVSNDIKQILAVHGERLDQTENLMKDILCKWMQFITESLI